MSKQELQENLAVLGWSQVELARRVEVSPVTVSRWVKVPGPVKAYVLQSLAIQKHGELVK